MMEEERYEAIELIVKSRPDGTSWFDILHDYITQDCDAVELEDGEWSPCSCSMESMGAMSGTLEQCCEWGERVGQGLKLIDLARTIAYLADPYQTELVNTEDRDKAIKWAKDQIYFEDHWNDEE